MKLEKVYNKDIFSFHLLREMENMFYRSMIMTRHELEDYCRTANIIPVSAIISYSIYGEMIPLYIRIEENSYKILSYEQKGNMSLNMPCSWICEIQDENYKKSIELIYFKDINIWGVRKRLK